MMLQMKKRFSHNYSAQVSYTYGRSRGNTSGNGAPGSNFQVGHDMHLELNEGPTDFDIPHNFTFSGTGARAQDERAATELGGARAERPPFTLTNGDVDPDQNGIQAEPLPAGDYSGTGTDAYTVKNYTAERNGARARAIFQARHALRLRVPPRRAAGGSRCGATCST